MHHQRRQQQNHRKHYRPPINQQQRQTQPTSRQHLRIKSITRRPPSPLPVLPPKNASPQSTSNSSPKKTPTPNKTLQPLQKTIPKIALPAGDKKRQSRLPLRPPKPKSPTSPATPCPPSTSLEVPTPKPIPQQRNELHSAPPKTILPPPLNHPPSTAPLTLPKRITSTFSATAPQTQSPPTPQANLLPSQLTSPETTKKETQNPPQQAEQSPPPAPTNKKTTP